MNTQPHAQPRGDHGTLIGNWVEERALQAHCGYTRNKPGDSYAEGSSWTLSRVQYHSNNCDNQDRVSMSSSAHIDPRLIEGPTAYHITDTFHRGNKTFSAANLPAQTAEEIKARRNLDQISFGAHTKPTSSVNQDTNFPIVHSTVDNVVDLPANPYHSSSSRPDVHPYMRLLQQAQPYRYSEQVDTKNDRYVSSSQAQ